MALELDLGKSYWEKTNLDFKLFASLSAILYLVSCVSIDL